SGGQKQKIILARILFRNTKMLLLDEPTSALDSLSETKIIDNLLKKSIPCILVSHKANLVKRFDKIIVISSGTIMECGNHESLIKKQGIYAEMFAAEKE
ncbi:MAG TPA: peptidase domain-containing ABC transporter, partial [Clostridium sp.]|nr:peptidase domain-containing ABC transporter [Clostridium sp.]